MKIIASFFIVLFLAFIATPSVVTYLDENVDVSLAFTANEEENSPKTEIAFEYLIHIDNRHTTSLHFLQEQTAFNHFYKEGYRLVYLDILSPPPKQA